MSASKATNTLLTAWVLILGQAWADQIFLHHGDHLSGDFVGMSSDKTTIQWQYPEAAHAFALDASTISHLLFESTTRAPLALERAFRIGLANGDWIAGQLDSLSTEQLTLTSTAAGKLTIPRHHVHSGQIQLGEHELHYRGPNNLREWRVGYRGKNWQLKRGQLISQGYSSTGCDVDFPDHALIEFDISMRHDPTLNVFLYADNAKNGG